MLNSKVLLLFVFSLVLVGALALAGPADPVTARGLVQEDETVTATFTILVENVSDVSQLPSPYAPGVWAVHTPDVSLFVPEAPANAGIEALAEDGNVAILSAALEEVPGVLSSGTFDGDPGPILPGSSVEFTVSVTDPNAVLSLASMYVQSNDVFVAPEGGVPLFEAGEPISGDITAQMLYWDAGTEVNEAPGSGPNQAPRQAGPNTGPTEGGVFTFTNTTHNYPIAAGIATINLVESDNGIYNVQLTNVSGNESSLTTPLAPVFYATHGPDASLFTEGAPAAITGLEALAEDGDPAGLVEAFTEAGIGNPGSQNTRTNGETGAAIPGETFQFSVQPTADTPILSLAAMVVESNDVFVAFPPQGLRLLDENGEPRPIEVINADAQRLLAVWDAGTEANETIGVGPNQAPRQAGPDTGPEDPDNTVRRYSDPTNDLGGPMAGGFVDMVIVKDDEPEAFNVTITNTSDETPYPGILTPVAFGVHNMTATLFTIGENTSEGLERLAEDGDSTQLIFELNNNNNVVQAGFAGEDPLQPGSSYNFNVVPDAEHRYFSFAAMVVPSNDTFIAFPPQGIALLNEDGSERTDEEIAADVAELVYAWDAGTEQNQSGALGPDQAPRQADRNIGPNEGNGLVSILDDGVWFYPPVQTTIRVTVTPN